MGSGAVKIKSVYKLAVIVTTLSIACACNITPTSLPATPVTILKTAPATTQPATEQVSQLTRTPTITATLEPTATETGTSTPSPTATLLPGFIGWSQAAEHIGEEITVCGTVVQAIFAESSNGQPTFLNLGLPYPDPERFTVLIWVSQRIHFPEPPEVLFLEKYVCASGTIELYQGSAEMIVSEPNQIVVYP